MKLRSGGLFAIGLIAVTAVPAFASGNFQRTGSMNVARVGHIATLLANGEVLVAGGDGSSAELYNPATGRWTLTGSMNVPRGDHQAVLLQNGQVLVAGGSNVSGTLPVPNCTTLQPAPGAPLAAPASPVLTPSLRGSRTAMCLSRAVLGVVVPPPIPLPRYMTLRQASSQWKTGRAGAERLMARAFKQARSSWRGEPSVWRATLILQQKRLIPLSYGTLPPRLG
jgi:hypothetical protein